MEKGKRRLRNLIGAARSSESTAGESTPYTVFCNGIDEGPCTEYFVAETGTRLPVYPDYRFRQKEGWRALWQYGTLGALQSRGLLDDDGERFLQDAIGERAVLKKPAEAEPVIERHVRRTPEAFLVGPQRIDLKPTRDETESRVRYFKGYHEKAFSRLVREGVFESGEVGNRRRLLEIGFTSGGHSLHALAAMGFVVTGVDNHYDGAASVTKVPDYVSEQMQRANAGPGVELLHDDIARSRLPAESFDLITSLSVVEHLREPQSAFSEMYRLLKPGGKISHRYHPYFCPTGGHALGTLDAPWSHVRLSRADFERYLSSMRPAEAEVAIQWTRGALNPDLYVRDLQRILHETGFRLLRWEETKDKTHGHWLTEEILADAFLQHPGLSLHDLQAASIWFVAVKPL